MKTVTASRRTPKKYYLLGAAAIALFSAKALMHEERIVPERDTAHTIQAPCCKLRVLKKDSEFMEEFKEHGPGLTLGDGLLIESIVRHPSMDYYTRNRICEAFSPEIAQNLLNLQVNDSLRIGIIQQFRGGVKLLQRGPELDYNQISRIVGLEGGLLYLVKLAESCILMDGLLRKGSSAFTSVAIHESTHAAQMKYMALNGLPAPKEADGEVFGYLSPIVHQNPWSGMIPLWHIAFLNHVHKPFEKMGLKFNSADSETSHLGGNIWNQLMQKLNISSPLEILSKSENDIRKSTMQLLDEKSKEMFGKPFHAIVSAEEMEQIRKKAEEFERSQ